jgi:tetratricopeptide (TPR) repeat protein
VSRGRAPALLLAAIGLLVGVRGATASVSLAEGPTTVARAADPEYRAALALVYDGAFHAAEERLSALSREHPEDPIGPYLHALAVEWRLEQSPNRRGLDDEVSALADEALARAEARLRHDGTDGRALMARGAAHGVKSRLHLFRWRKGEARSEAVRMRGGLLEARAAGVEVVDLDFGLGLYDYYADTLPRFFKLLRFLAGMPGGDRARGLQAIARVARGGSLFHDDEACVQMFEIESFFERRPDRALPWIRKMWRRYPGWPLWGLKLADFLRDRLGLYDDSADVAREILTAADEKRHVNYQPVVGAMARVLLGEALLLDLQPAAAREAARPVTDGIPEAAWVGPRASWVVARSLELDGDREAALPHYRRVASGPEPAVAQRAREALARPLPDRERVAWRRLAAARRLREGGRTREAHDQCLEALRAHPSNPEARVCVAERRLRAADPAAAAALVRGVSEAATAPPWLRAHARLVLAEALEREGRIQAALSLYKKVWQEPFGRAALQDSAVEGVRRLDPSATLPSTPSWEE